MRIEFLAFKHFFKQKIVGCRGKVVKKHPSITLSRLFLFGSEKKKEIVKLWFDTYQIDLSLRKKTGEDLLALASKNNLYDYIVENCMRED